MSPLYYIDHMKKTTKAKKTVMVRVAVDDKRLLDSLNKWDGAPRPRHLGRAIRMYHKEMMKVKGRANSIQAATRYLEEKGK